MQFDQMFAEFTIDSLQTRADRFSRPYARSKAVQLVIPQAQSSKTSGAHSHSATKRSTQGRRDRRSARRGIVLGRYAGGDGKRCLEAVGGRQHEFVAAIERTMIVVGSLVRVRAKRVEADLSRSETCTGAVLPNPGRITPQLTFNSLKPVVNARNSDAYATSRHR